MLTNRELIDKALTVLKPRALSNDNSAGSVACALLSASGQIYLGICIDVGSGIGFCAEHSAVAAMLTAGESAIDKIVAVAEGPIVLPPCGRCREFMFQINADNLNRTLVVLNEQLALPLSELLPHPYTEVWDSPPAPPPAPGAKA